MPTGPGRTALAKPRPTPWTTAVPAPGPMTSRPRRDASCFSATSWSRGTLSLKTSTDIPACRASIASTKAWGPGTEMRARFAPATAATRVGGGASKRPPDAAGGGARAASAAAIAAAAAASEEARTATTRSSGPIPSGAAKPRPASRERLRSVAMATRARSTPGTASAAALACMSRTESK